MERASDVPLRSSESWDEVEKDENVGEATTKLSVFLFIVGVVIIIAVPYGLSYLRNTTISLHFRGGPCVVYSESENAFVTGDCEDPLRYFRLDSPTGLTLLPRTSFIPTTKANTVLCGLIPSFSCGPDISYQLKVVGISLVKYPFYQIQIPTLNNKENITCFGLSADNNLTLTLCKQGDNVARNTMLRIPYQCSGPLLLLTILLAIITACIIIMLIALKCQEGKFVHNTISSATADARKTPGRMVTVLFGSFGVLILWLHYDQWETSPQATSWTLLVGLIVGVLSTCIGIFPGGDWYKKHLPDFSSRKAGIHLLSTVLTLGFMASEPLILYNEVVDQDLQFIALIIMGVSYFFSLCMILFGCCSQDIFKHISFISEACAFAAAVATMYVATASRASYPLSCLVR